MRSRSALALCLAGLAGACAPEAQPVRGYRVAPAAVEEDALPIVAAAEPPRVELAPQPPRIVAAASPDAVTVLGELLNRLRLSVEEADDRTAIELVLAGRCEVAVVTRPVSPNERALGACDRILGWQIPVVVVAIDHPVRGVMRTMLREVLAARVDSWAELGGEPDRISLLVPPPGEVADRLAAQLMPGERIARSATCLADPKTRLDACAASRLALALAELCDLRGRTDVRPLPIDGVSPGMLELAQGRYAGGCALRLVWKQAGTNVAWLLTEVRTEAWLAAASRRLSL